MRMCPPKSLFKNYCASKLNNMYYKYAIPKKETIRTKLCAIRYHLSSIPPIPQHSFSNEIIITSPPKTPYPKRTKVLFSTRVLPTQRMTSHHLSPHPQSSFPHLHTIYYVLGVFFLASAFTLRLYSALLLMNKLYASLWAGLLGFGVSSKS